MNSSQRKIIGVVAAEVNCIEQRQIMCGIIEQAKSEQVDIAVFSNVYNPYEYDEMLSCENQIYDLMQSDELSGLIVIAESFTNHQLKQKIKDDLAQRTDLPIVILGAPGAPIDELITPNIQYLNTSDEADIADITTHLIEAHGFTDIDMLTGFEDHQAAILRVQGYRKALEQHGIPYDPDKVIFGNYWTNSGEELAEEYRLKKRKLPQAIVCANDYMAYGLLDGLLTSQIRVPQDVSVIGYEYVQERVYHVPLLSTYQRNRKALGQAAVTNLLARIKNEEPPVFLPPTGMRIPGATCPCPDSGAFLAEELEEMRIKQTYDQWMIFGQMEQKLVTCKTLEEYIKTLGEFHFLVRNVNYIYLCLFEHWYDPRCLSEEDSLLCRNLAPWYHGTQPSPIKKHQLAALFQNNDQTAAHYYTPLFFHNRLLGYFILGYMQPDTYDTIYRNWLKAAANGLEFLCIKNDIQYLLQCQNLSTQHDTITGLYNRSGMEKAVSVRMAHAPENCCILGFRIIPNSTYSKLDLQESNYQLYCCIADTLRSLGHNDSVCGRTDPDTFLAVGFPFTSTEDCQLLESHLTALLIHQPHFLSLYDMESFVCCCLPFSAAQNPQTGVDAILARLDEQTKVLQLQKKRPHAGSLCKIRTSLYAQKQGSIQKFCKHYSYSEGYFRQIYKEHFGISFHQDWINARVSYAIYLLSTSSLSIASLAEQCGYTDYHYFLRQFQKITGKTPNQYRKALLLGDEH